MRVSERGRRHIILLVVAALASLVARVVAVRFGASDAVGTGLYAVAMVCMVGCVLVLVRESR